MIRDIRPIDRILIKIENVWGVKMGGASYNGYSWNWRAKIIPAFKCATGRPYPFEEEPCAMCGDPDRDPSNWHSEDYSEPFSYEPPESYPVCRVCHSRLHKRFNAAPGEWLLYCQHLAVGGYGSEFTKSMKLEERRALARQISNGQSVKLPLIRSPLATIRWWEALTLDPESLDAPWARPRPLRPRPNKDEFMSAFADARLSHIERLILSFHANSVKRTATMRQIYAHCYSEGNPRPINLQYGRLARRLCKILNWKPDTRADSSEIWLSLLAEGWQPQGREYEWTMVKTAAEAVKALRFDISG